MRNGIWNKRIPTLFGIFAIVIGIGVTSFLVKQGSILVGQASPSDIPQNVKISNISDASFTVSYTTDSTVLGSLNYGDNVNLGKTILDDRDQGQIVTSRHTHVITLKNLTPKTTYLFSITSGQNTFLDNGSLFKAKTGPSLESPSLQRGEISGKVILPNGSIPKEAFLYVATGGAQTLSTIIKPDGSYSLSLNPLRSQDLSSYFIIPQQTIFTISLFGDSLTSKATISSDKTTNVPTVTLSKDYDFTINNNPILQTQTSSPSANVVFPQATPSSALNSTPQILTPKQDQSFSDTQPLFKGTALPNQDVSITIHSPEQITAQVQADASGNWTYRPSSSLSAGDHTISIITRDAFGILKTITQSFTVYASGSQVNQPATPSATLTPTLTSTPTPTITLSPTPTATPSPTLIATIAAVASQSPTLTISPTINPLPTAILPQTGSSTAPIAAMFSIGFIVVGALLFLFTRAGL